ncbi:MAG: YigZ family protein [Bacteroidetes bacterium]|nr:YigZ family protein [Bacteroidota bacterium]
MTDQIQTIEQQHETKFKEKGSLFIGQVYPVNSVEEAEEFLTSVRKKFYDATHHCYAYRIMENDSKYSDDGEPNGTAGIRIANAINHFELTNLLVISIRYYGGTKLGVGPLGKAYYQSAYDTLSEMEIVTKKNFSKLKVAFEYDHISKIHHLLNQHTTQILDNLFEERPAILFLIRNNELDNLSTEIIESTNDSAHLEVVEENIFIENPKI